jgi:hypothetical protein
MEMTGVGEAAQFMNVAVSGGAAVGNFGLEAIKLSASGLHFTLSQLKKFVLFIAATIKKQAAHMSPGEVGIEKLIKNCNNSNSKIGLISMDRANEKEFSDYCQQHGLAYSKLVDVDDKSGKIEVAYNADQSQSIFFEKYMREHSDHAKPYSFVEYVDKATDEKVVELENDLKNSNHNAILEEFMKTEKIIKEAEAANPGYDVVKFDKEQLVGVTDELCEFTLLDGDNKRYYIDIAADSVEITEDGKFTVPLNRKYNYMVNDQAGLIKQPDNSYLDVRNVREGNRYPCDTNLICSLVNFDKAKRKNADMQGQSFINSRDKDAKVVQFPVVRKHSKAELEMPEIVKSK